MSEKIQVELAMAISNFKDNMPAYIEKLKIDSKLHKVKYDSLIRHGFTEVQALELCKNIY